MFHQEIGDRVLPVTIAETDGRVVRVEMEQQPARAGRHCEDVAGLAAAFMARTFLMRLHAARTARIVGGGGIDSRLHPRSFTSLSQAEEETARAASTSA